MATPVPSSRSGKWMGRLISGVLLLWSGLVFSLYFPFPRSLDLTFIKTLFLRPQTMDLDKFLANGMGSLEILAINAVVLFTLWRWGRKILFWMGLGPGNPLLRFCREMALGILFFNGLWLGLGFNGLWFTPFLKPLFFLFFGWALWDFFRRFMKFQRLPRWEWPGWLPLGLAGLGWLFLAVSLAQGLLPEIYFDGLVYHLATLRFWLDRHGITDFYTNLYSYYPFGAELYFFNGFFLQGSEAAKTLNVFASFLCALAAAGWVMEEAGSAYGCLAWAMALFFPLVSATVWTTQNDVLLAFFFILFFNALLNWSRQKEVRAWALAAGIFGGAALTVKYTAVLGIAACLPALALAERRVFSIRRWKGWALGTLAMGLSLAPWLLKNVSFTGNGIYPYLSHWLGGRSLSPEGMAALMNDHQAAFGDHFSLPAWAGRVLTVDLDKTIAPLLFSFLPFLFLPGRRRPTTKFLGVAAGLWLVGGFLVSHQLRLMIPAFQVFFLLVVFTLADLERKRWTTPAGWILLAFGVLSFLSIGRFSLDYYHADQVWLGKQTRQEYLAAPPQTSSYMDLTRAAGALPKGDRLLIVGDARSLYYPRSFYANSVFDDQVLVDMARRERNEEGIAEGLRRMGVDDLVVSGQEGARLSRQYPYYRLDKGEWMKLDNFIQRRTDLVYLKGINGIYRLRTAPVERKSRIPDLLKVFQVPSGIPEKVF